jgi:predicted Zn-dependent protease
MMCPLAIVIVLCSISVNGLAQSEAGDRLHRLGSQLTGEIRRQTSVVEDPDLSRYVYHLVEILLGKSGATFAITIVDSDETETFSLPGYNFFISTGAIRSARDERSLEGTVAKMLANAEPRLVTRVNSGRQQPILNSVEFAKLRVLVTAAHGQ